MYVLDAQFSSHKKGRAKRAEGRKEREINARKKSEGTNLEAIRAVDMFSQNAKGGEAERDGRFWGVKVGLSLGDLFGWDDLVRIKGFVSPLYTTRSPGTHI
jgi:hypothetical protein